MSAKDIIDSAINSYIGIAKESEFEYFAIVLKFRSREAESLEICTRSPGVFIYTSDTLEVPQLSKFKESQQIKNLIISFAIMNPTIGFTLFDADDGTTMIEIKSAANIDDRVVQLYNQKYCDVNKISMSIDGCDIQIFIFVADSNSFKSVAINDDGADETLRFAIEKSLNIHHGTKTEDLKFVAIFKDIFDRNKTLKALGSKLQREVTARFNAVCFEGLGEFKTRENDFKSAKPLDLKPSVIDLTELSQQNDTNMKLVEVIRDADYLGDDIFYQVCGSDGMSVDDVEGVDYDRITFLTQSVDKELIQAFLGNISDYANSEYFMLNADGSYVEKFETFAPPEVQNSENEILDETQQNSAEKIQFNSVNAPAKPAKKARVSKEYKIPKKSKTESKQPKFEVTFDNLHEITGMKLPSSEGVVRKRPFKNATNAVDQGKPSQERPQVNYEKVLSKIPKLTRSPEFPSVVRQPDSITNFMNEIEVDSGSKENVDGNDVTNDLNNNKKKKLYNPVDIAVPIGNGGSYRIFKNRNSRSQK